MKVIPVRYGSGANVQAITSIIRDGKWYIARTPGRPGRATCYRTFSEALIALYGDRIHGMRDHDWQYGTDERLPARMRTCKRCNHAEIFCMAHYRWELKPRNPFQGAHHHILPTGKYLACDPAITYTWPPPSSHTRTYGNYEAHYLDHLKDGRKSNVR